MSEVPYVNRLGDALEEAVAAERAQRPRRAWWRRPPALVVFAVLAVGCGVTAARVLMSSQTLAIHPVECLAGPISSSQIAFPENGGGSPVQICARALNVPAAKLIACAGGRYTYVSVFYASGTDQCRRLGLRPLPAAYGAAQRRVDRLGRELSALQASAYCIPPATFARRTRQILDRLGWSGWRVRASATVRDEVGVIGGGDCAVLPGGASASFPPDIRYALDPDHRELSFDLGPPPALSRLVDSQAVSIERSTGGRCWSLGRLRTDVRRRLARRHLAAAFAVTTEPQGEGFDAGRQARYDQGCPIVVVMRTAADNLRLVDVWIDQRGAGPPPSYGLPPQWAFD